MHRLSLVFGREANLSSRDRYGEDKELTEDYAKDIWEFGY